MSRAKTLELALPFQKSINQSKPTLRDSKGCIFCFEIDGEGPSIKVFPGIRPPSAIRPKSTKSTVRQ